MRVRAMSCGRATGAESARGCDLRLRRQRLFRSQRACAAAGRVASVPPGEASVRARPERGALYFWARGGGAIGLQELGGSVAGCRVPGMLCARRRRAEHPMP